jgi:hypothetical protein
VDRTEHGKLTKGEDPKPSSLPLRAVRRRAGPSFWLPENLPHLLHEFRGIVNLKTSRLTILQIDDQVLPPTNGAGKDEPLDGSRPQEVAEFHRRDEIVGGEAALPNGGDRLRQSPL